MNYAVLTGDLVSSSRLNRADRESALGALKSGFEAVGRIPGMSVLGRFEIFRGDSFQGVLEPAAQGVRGAIALMAAARSLSPPGEAGTVRVAVGVGPAESLPGMAMGTGEASGPAFVRSGKALDDMRGIRRLSVRTPWAHADQELDVECRLLDSVLLTWSAKQAEAVWMAVDGLTQRESAERIGISQPAVATRLLRGGWDGIRPFLARAEFLLGGGVIK